jgi:hypothetical protein
MAGVNYISTETGIEAEIRSKYRVARPGESIAIITENREGDKRSTTTKDTGVWNRILRIFGVGD